MKKVLDKDLEKKIGEIIEVEGDGAAPTIVGLMKELQDSSGVKVCQNVSKDDVAYKEVK